jgi:hypothetical protein
VVEEFIERLALNTRATQMSDMEILNLKKLNEVEGKEQNQITISHIIAVIEILDNAVDIDSSVKYKI